MGKRILILAPVLSDLPQIARYSDNLVSFFKEFTEEGEKADILTFDDKSHLDCSFDRYQLDDYQKASEVINKNYDACVLQHHPEAFGGRNGDYILALVDQLNVPLITVFHTINSEPEDREKAVIKSLANRSEKVMVYSRLAIEFLEHYYKVNRDKILRTDYGVSVFDSYSTEELKQVLSVDYQKTILACGAMEPTSGFETIINALSALQKNYPETGLVLINTSHDKSASSEYQKLLKRLAAQRGVAELLTFVNYHDVKDNIEMLMNAADVYVASGINDRVLEDAFLATAVSSGATVLSTPTWYAKELLEDQKGGFFAFRSINELTTEIIHMFRSLNEAKMYRENASLFGAQNSWAVIVKKFKEMISGIDINKGKVLSERVSFTPVILPEINLNQLFLLNNCTGFVNASTYGIPDYASGYSLLANAMAMQVLAKANALKQSNDTIKGIKQCIGLIKLFRKDNSWSSSLNPQLQPASDVSEYELGYTVWALSTVYSSIDDNGVKDVIYGLVLQLISEVDFTNSKAIAAVLIGLVELLRKEHSNPDLVELMKKWTHQLKALFPSDAYQAWQWHEDEVSEHVGLVPLALMYAYELLKEEELLSIAKRAIRFVERHVFTDARYNPKIRGRKKDMAESGVTSSSFATDTYIITEVYTKLFEITRVEKYLNMATAAHNWYLGDNTIGRSLYDIASGGCYDSYSGRSVNPLMTTSSTAAYWLSHFAIHDAYFDKILSDFST